jgi:putative radical SAM enzyme (TIGR03279 family)
VNPESPPGLISGVRPGSLAAEAGIQPGDILVSIAGRTPRDVVDVQFYQADELVQVQVRKANGLDDLVEFEKSADEDLGFEFERATWDQVTLCNNHCFFCFLKGLPRGMRKPLYLKDDDYRLSFLHGNFVTLTNLEESDWDRLEEQRLSPLNVSVHATDLALRRRMLGNPNAPDILEQLRRLGDLGLRAHTQIVLCPGVNDGHNLDRSIADLGALYPIVQTISVVPVGASPRLEDRALAKDGVELIRPSPEYARALVRQIRPRQRQFRQLHGATIVQCSDEYYITAGASVPPASHYDGFVQYENGIGMVRTMLDDWHRTRRRLRRQGPSANATGRRLAIASGTLIAPRLAAIASEMEALTGATVSVVPVPNRVFGGRVNVSGLLCGADIRDALTGTRADLVILPRPSLDYFGERFLDGMTAAEMESALCRPVGFASQWSEVAEMLAMGPTPPGRGQTSNGAFWSEPHHQLAPAR